MTKKKSKKNNSKKRTTSPFSDSSKWIAAFGIFIFAFLLYSNTFNHGFVLDDDLVCKKNDFVQSGVSGLKDIFTHSWYYGFAHTADRYYRPMMLAGFAVETSFFGKSAGVYHFMNVLYYALSCSFLFFVIRLLFREKHFLFPLAIALLFTAHPLHVEVVANIKSRDEIFAFLGLLGVIYSLIQYHRKSNVIYFILALTSYFFAILSKEGALAILGLVPLVLYFFTKTSWKKIVVQTGSFGIIAAIYFAIRMGIIDHSPNPFETIDNSLFAIQNTSNRLATAVGMIGEYFRLLVFPHPLSFDYSFNSFPESSWTNAKTLTSLAAISGLIYLTIKGLRNKKIISFAILFFAITFVITSNIFFLIGATFAERFMFVPLLGFSIGVIVLLWKYLNLDENKNYTLFYGIVGGLLFFYSTKTFTQNEIWKSDATLFETGIKTAPNSARTQSFYGVMHVRKAAIEKDINKKKELLNTAVKHLQNSVNIYPKFTEAYQHLASAYEAQNNTQLAIQSYQKAINSNAEYFPAMTNMGILFYKNKNYNQAEVYLKKALNIAPNHVVTHRALGLVYKDKMQYDLAITHFKNALDAQYNKTHLTDLGMLYEKMGNTEMAIFYNEEIKKLLN